MDGFSPRENLFEVTHELISTAKRILQRIIDDRAAVGLALFATNKHAKRKTVIFFLI